MDDKAYSESLTNFSDDLPLTIEQYQAAYEYSLKNPEDFWAKQAAHFVTWSKPWQKVVSGSLAKGDVRWFSGGELNVCYNCLDRHLPTRGDQPAIIWEGDSPRESKKLTYNQLFKEVCRFANALRRLGVKKGHRVCIYMPMIPEAAIAMLACARIGAIHSVVFAGFSAEALRQRVLDADCHTVITADESLRGGKHIPLKEKVDTALLECPNVHSVVVVRQSKRKIPWDPNRDVWYHHIMTAATNHCPAEPMAATDPLFILYTSGSTGKPKGVLHGSGGYLVYAAMTHKVVFNYDEGEVYWCTADVGWITGHSYVVYGPLVNGATTLMFGGIPAYPDSSRYWRIVAKYHVNTFYTAPTAIRALMREGEDPVRRTNRHSLKLLGSVGEPINPEVWQWYHRVVGGGRCPIVDTWWQTETGGIVITPLPGTSQLKPGAASLPFFGMELALLDNKGKELKGEATGQLVIKKPWPGMMQTVYGNQKRFVETYLQQYPGVFVTGDLAKRDADGYYWIIGRVDDVINVSGHRLGTAEIESALVAHELVAEAAVVGFPHEIKGEGIYAYVTLLADAEPSDKLKKELTALASKAIGPIAKPDQIQWANALPKTRSGKIMRRILRKIAKNEFDELGDISTLANPDVVSDLIADKVMQIDIVEAVGR